MYKAAYATVPDPAYLYNVAQAYRIAKNLPQALFFYRSFLRAAPESENRDEVQVRIQKLEAQIKDAEKLAPPPIVVVPTRLPAPVARAGVAVAIGITQAPSSGPGQAMTSAGTFRF